MFCINPSVTLPSIVFYFLLIICEKLLQSFFISLRKSSIFDVTRVNSVSHNLDFCFSVEIAYLIKHMSSEIKVDKKEGILLWMVSMPQLYYKWHYTIFLLLLQVLCDGARFHFSIVQTHTFFSFFFLSDCSTPMKCGRSSRCSLGTNLFCESEREEIYLAPSSVSLLSCQQVFSQCFSMSFFTFSLFRGSG